MKFNSLLLASIIAVTLSMAGCAGYKGGKDSSGASAGTHDQSIFPATAPNTD